MPDNGDNEERVRTGNLVHQAVKTALVTQVRVDEQRLRRRSDDTLPRILEILTREKAALDAKTIDGGAES